MCQGSRGFAGKRSHGSKDSTKGVSSNSRSTTYCSSNKADSEHFVKAHVKGIVELPKKYISLSDDLCNNWLGSLDLDKGSKKTDFDDFINKLKASSTETRRRVKKEDYERAIKNAFSNETEEKLVEIGCSRDACKHLKENACNLVENEGNTINLKSVYEQLEKNIKLTGVEDVIVKKAFTLIINEVDSVLDTEKKSVQSNVVEVFATLLDCRKSDFDRDNIEVKLVENSAPNDNLLNFFPCSALKPRLDFFIGAKRKGSSEDMAAVGVCELKREKFAVKDLRQLIMYMVIAQRSVTLRDDHWHLCGLLLNKTDAIFVKLRSSSWWSHWVEVVSIEKYKIDTGKQLYAVVREYMSIVFSNWNDEKTSMLETPSHKLPYFEYPAGVERLNERSPHIVKAPLQTVNQLFPVNERLWKNDNLLLTDADSVVVKVVAKSIYTYGESLDRFDLFLNKIEIDKEKVVHSVLNDYVFISRCGVSEALVIVSRYSGNRVCSCTEVLKRFEADNILRQNFYEKVCEPAISVILLKFYHGDIRPANVVFDGINFHLLDWDDVCRVGQERGINGDGAYPVLLKYKVMDNFAMNKARLFTLSQLFVTALIIRLCASKCNTNMDLKEYARSLENVWRSKKFWERKKRSGKLVVEAFKHGFQELRCAMFNEKSYGWKWDCTEWKQLVSNTLKKVLSIS